MVRSRRGRNGNGTDSWSSQHQLSTRVDLSSPRGTGISELHLGKMGLSPGKALVLEGVDNTF